jgi:hypothetical protein
MKSLLGIALFMASTGWAAPLSINGSAYTNIGIHVNGPDGFQFDSSGGSGAWVFYRDCSADQACDLSGGVAFSGLLDGGFFASDGTTSVGVDAGPAGTPPGVGAFSITWTATPFFLDTLPGVPPAEDILLHVPVAVSGLLQAWTEQEIASNSAPFFNYSFHGQGTLRVEANLLYDFSRPPHNPVLVSAEFVGADTTFTGTAEFVPEPASWWLALPIVAVVLFRRTRRPTVSEMA